MDPPDKHSGNPDHDQFAQLMLDALRQAGEKAPVHYDSAGFRLVTKEPDLGFFNLHNAYAEYCAADPPKRPAVLRRFVRNWFSRSKEMPEEFEDVRPDLFPVLRPRSYFELLRLQLQIEGKEKLSLQYEVVGDHFGLAVAYDLPEAIRILSGDHLDEWKVTFAQAIGVAKGNLAEISTEPLEGAAPGVWLSPWRDNYDAARLVLLDLIRGHEVNGDPIAIVPNRDTLILTGSQDTPGLESMIDLADEAFSKPRPLLGVALRLVGDEWKPYLPPPDHHLHNRFKLLLVQSLGHDYGEQKALLEKRLEKDNEDVFVASYSAMQHKDSGKITSYSVWSEGIETLLPRTDLVMFFRPTPGGQDGSIVASGAWEQVWQVTGGLMTKTDLYPERYRVEAFPSDEQLAAIGLRA